jgi:hypothetical protein
MYLYWNQRAERAKAAARDLGEIWMRIRRDGMSLPALLDLRACSRAYSYDCPDSASANLAIALENAAEALYRDGQRPDPRWPREAIVRELDELVARIHATVEPIAA